MRTFYITLLLFTFCLPGTVAGDGDGDDRTIRPKNEYARGRSKHKAAVDTISNIIAAETGLPAADFRTYAGNLANTLGQLDQAALARVFGENFNQLP